MTPINLLPPPAALSLANPDPAPNEPLQEPAVPPDMQDDALARLALLEALARMLSAPGDEASNDEPVSDPTAALIGIVLDTAMKDSLLQPRGITD